MTGRPAPTHEAVDAARAVIDAWLDDEVTTNPVVAAVERASTAEAAEGGARARWYVRVEGDEKSVFSIWFTLRQRTLHFETYVLPAPQTNAGELYEHLLRRNAKLHGIAFSIGAEDAVFLAGEIPVGAVHPDALDEALGSLYAATELCFRPAMRLGFAGAFRG